MLEALESGTPTSEEEAPVKRRSGKPTSEEEAPGKWPASENITSR